MQKIPFILLLLICAAVFSSCGKKQILERRLKGEWNLVKITDQTYFNDNLDSEVISSPTASLTLNDDGSGIFFDGFSEIEIEWSNEKFEVILHAPSQDITFTVIENKKNKQVWRRSSSDTVSGVKVTDVVIWELEKN